ncbi:MAG: hypothetical protein V3S55_06355 [Nitrospiraceae bacterium]
MSEQDVIPDPEDEGEGKGNTQGAVSPNKEVEGLRTGIIAERHKVQALKEETAELRGKLSAREESATRQAPDETTFSRSQLDAAVADGRVTQDEADRIYHKQVVREVTEEVTAKVTETTTVNAVGLEIRKYQDALPVLSVRGSDEFAKVEKEFAWMVSNGSPNNLSTELAAMRSVFGDSTKMKADKGKKVLETHQETGGSAQEGSDSEDSSPGGRPPKGLSRDAKKHYGTQIERGMYANWAAVSKELEGASPSVKARLGI